ncbi:MAG: dockerin type I repeat-containing protein, partial [Lachnospiraceae bacterium]|nr:dockerin type I repeat-containing protein [Lachnospiraceae bacterium]
MSLLWKKALGWMLCLVMVVGILPGVVEKTKAAETVSHIAGDANLDGQVDLSDVSCILRNYAVMSSSEDESYYWDEQQYYNTDLNCDGKIDSLDATLLGEYLVYLHDASEFVIRQGGAVVLPSSRVTGGNDGGDNPDIRFSFVDDQQTDTIVVEYGKSKTISISAKIYAGQNPITGIEAQFLGSS